MRWPEPLLQPDRNEGCFIHSMAYLCHCFGHTEVTPEQVQAFREAEHKWEGVFPSLHCGLALERYWDYVDKDEEERRRYWLGPGTRPWVEKHLAQGQISAVIVERVVGLAHALVLLESRGDAGVLVMDPLYGHRIDTWEWFLSIGPGNHGCHHIDGWYSLKE
jgi:hypothetical protein